MKELYIAPAIEVTRFAPAQSIATEDLDIQLGGDIYGSVTEEGGGDEF